jgi:hypothetical protein
MNLAKYVDALIPGVAGIFLIIGPEVFLAKSIVGETRRRRISVLRGIGCVLIGVAALYVVIAAMR